MTSRILIYLLLVSVPVSYAQATSLPEGIIELNPYVAPTIKLADIDNESYNLAEDTGHWVFVHFWASWCVPCRREMPAIQNMWNQMEHKGLKMALINTAEDEDTVFSFLGVYAPDIRPLMDGNGQVTELWKPRGLPATYIVDPRGRVRYQALGGREWNTPGYLSFLRNLIEK